MTDHMPDDLSAAGKDMREFTDELRAKFSVVKNISDEWVFLKHADVVAAALDHDRFSSKVSRYLQIPNGLDGLEHSEYRKVIERYLTPEALVPFTESFERIALQLVSELPVGSVFDAVTDVGAIFAVRAQCEWLGWPATLEPLLLDWMKDNHAATRSGDAAWTADVAAKFDDIVRSVIQPRRGAVNSETVDVTSRLCREKVKGRLLSEAELVSILRNWTGGDLGSIALCVGVIIAYLAKHPELAMQLKTAADDEVDAAIDEILRIDNPFVSNRRITTCPVQIGDKTIPAGARVKLNWTSANRDEAVFKKDAFDPAGHREANLVYGIGKHVCPGRLLATIELRVAVKTLLNSINTIELATDQPLVREIAPLGGYHRVPVIIT
ncbi:cytochrome P450 [Reinekea sp.]|jgi:cytochrome P450|uniref:cytochrome P450 n=1 Tax=Reinekea sp. TaxID=1970455 RepID=UPI0039899F2F